MVNMLTRSKWLGIKYYLQGIAFVPLLREILDRWLMISSLLSGIEITQEICIQLTMTSLLMTI